MALANKWVRLQNSASSDTDVALLKLNRQTGAAMWTEGLEIYSVVMRRLKQRD